MRSVATIFIFLAATSAHAQCDPVDFLVKDITNVTLSDELKTAFLQVATREQYEQATAGGKASLAFGPISGSVDYNQAKTSSTKEASLRKYDYDRNYYLRYITQKLPPKAAEMYSMCLESSMRTSGLRLWLAKKEAKYYYVRGFWVGQDTGKPDGLLEGEPVIRGFQAIQSPPIPTKWAKGEVYEILFEKSPEVDGILSLSVGGQTANLVAVGELPIVSMATVKVVSDEPVVSISSGGSSDGNHPVVQPKQQMSCVYPSKPGRALLPGSGNVGDLNVSAVQGRATAVVVRDTPDVICYEFKTSTGDKHQVNSIRGRAIALERYVLPN